MSKGLLLSVFLIASTLGFGAETGWSANEKTREAKGLNFNVPEDWPIEERGGVVGPIPTEEYLAQKFGKADARFSALEAKLDEINRKLSGINTQLKKMGDTTVNVDERLTDLEGWLKQGRARRL